VPQGIRWMTMTMHSLFAASATFANELCYRTRRQQNTAEQRSFMLSFLCI